MPGTVTYCPKCKHAIPDGESRCIACGGPKVGAISISRSSSGRPQGGAKAMAKGAPHDESRLLAIIVGVLMFVLIGVLIYRYGPMIEFPGRAGAVTVEQGDGMPTGEELNGIIEEQFPIEQDGPHDKAMITITNLDNPRSGKHSTLGYKTPVGELEIGMTPSQVIEKWGQPLSQENIHLDRKSLESWTMAQEGRNTSIQRGGIVQRWVYGDPLYGIFVTGRYADFRDGRLDYYYMEPQMDKLYRAAIEQRMRSSLF